MDIKKSVYNVVFIGMSTLGAISSALAIDSQYLPYIGLGFQQKNLRLEPGYGKQAFAARLLEPGLYVGFRAHDYLNIEAGHTVAQGTRTYLAETNTNFLGKYESGIQYETAQNKIKLKTTYLNLMGQLPLQSHPNFHLIGFVGVSSLKVDASVKIVADEFAVYPPNEIARRAFYFESRRVTPQFGGGFGYQVFKNIQLRILGSYQMTKRFKRMVARLAASGVSLDRRMSLENTLNYGIGLNYQFK